MKPSAGCLAYRKAAVTVACEQEGRDDNGGRADVVPRSLGSLHALPWMSRAWAVSILQWAHCSDLCLTPSYLCVLCEYMSMLSVYQQKQTECPSKTLLERLRGFVKSTFFKPFVVVVALELFYSVRTYPGALAYGSYRTGDALVGIATPSGLRTGS